MLVYENLTSHKNSSALSHKPQSSHHTTSKRSRMSNQMILLHKKKHKTGQKCSQNLQCLYILESTIEHFLLQGIFDSLGNVPKRSYSRSREEFEISQTLDKYSRLIKSSQYYLLYSCSLGNSVAMPLRSEYDFFCAFSKSKE